MTLRPVAPEGLHAIWPWVREGVTQSALKTKQRYMPEDVWLMLQAKTATLYLVDDSDVGFMVIQRGQDPDGPVLFVFLLWAPNQAQERQDALYAAVEDLARSIKAKRIRMQGRKGWESQPFWKPTAIIYEHELD